MPTVTCPLESAAPDSFPPLAVSADMPVLVSLIDPVFRPGPSADGAAGVVAAVAPAATGQDDGHQTSRCL